MIRVLCFIHLLVVSLFSGTVISSELDQHVVSIGQHESQILSKLGKPISVSLESPDEITGMNKTKLLKYKGANLDFHFGSNGFYLWRLELTSNEFSYFNKTVIVGAKSNDILNILGEPRSKEIKGKIIVWFYPTQGFDGWVQIKLVNGIVVSVFATEDWT